VKEAMAAMGLAEEAVAVAVAVAQAIVGLISPTSSLVSPKAAMVQLAPVALLAQVPLLAAILVITATAAVPAVTDLLLESAAEAAAEAAVSA
jgi:hypothetical protein